MQSPMLRCPTTKLELADRTKAVACGGLPLVQQMVTQVALAESINRHCPIFKMHLPYTEADHVLNIAFNSFAGGTCLEHLELRRNDEAYLDLLGAQRIPDPTTAGDFCRRFSPQAVDRLMDAINDARIKVWQQQPDSFFKLAVIAGDGTMVETTGEKKEGIGLNHNKQWGYQVLALTLANTREQLFLLNRPGNRPSHEGAAAYFDKSVQLCRRAGFRKVRLRGDTDFSQTTHLDRWHSDGVEFVFGCDAAPNLVKFAEGETSKQNGEDTTRASQPQRSVRRCKGVPQSDSRRRRGGRIRVPPDGVQTVVSHDRASQNHSHDGRPDVSVSRTEVLLLHHQSPEANDADGTHRGRIQLALRSGKHLRSGQSHGSPVGPAARPDQQLGVHGDRHAGMESEVLAESFAETGRQRNGSRETPGPEETSAANGFLDVPPAVDPRSSTDPDTRTPVDLSTSVMDSRDRNDVRAA
jgi:hypothetical protein